MQDHWRRRRASPSRAPLTGAVHESLVSKIVQSRLRGEEIDLLGAVRQLRQDLARTIAPRERSAAPSPPDVTRDALAVGAPPVSSAFAFAAEGPPSPSKPRSAPDHQADHEESEGSEADVTRGSTTERGDAGHVLVEAGAELEGAARLRKVLGDLRLRVSELDPQNVLTTPGFVRYRVQFGPSVRLAQIRARAEDIARGMGSTATPLVSNSPGETYVAIDFPNSVDVPVSLWPVLDRIGEPAPHEIPLLLGVLPSGGPLVIDLAEAPHLLVGGTSGSGKTTFLHGVLAGLTRDRTADQLELLLVDPKETDLSVYSSLPHLRGRGVLSDGYATVNAVEAIVAQEFEARTAVLKDTGFASVSDLNRAAGCVRQRPLIVVIEEFSELLESFEDKRGARDLQRNVLRIAQRARSLGIHLILVSQRPSVDVLAGKLKGNVPVRICFRVASRVDSQVVLDRAGAELLHGRGDFLLARDGELTRGHSCFASMDEIRRFVADLSTPGSQKVPT
jgi:DNA segregation ATPase FtsK/SpoIIIE-like protein